MGIAVRVPPANLYGSFGECIETQVHIRGVWDSQSNNSNPLCTNHQTCFTGTWVYFRID